MGQFAVLGKGGAGNNITMAMLQAERNLIEDYGVRFSTKSNIHEYGFLMQDTSLNDYRQHWMSVYGIYKTKPPTSDPRELNNNIESPIYQIAPFANIGGAGNNPLAGAFLGMLHYEVGKKIGTEPEHIIAKCSSTTKMGTIEYEPIDRSDGILSVGGLGQGTYTGAGPFLDMVLNEHIMGLPLYSLSVLPQYPSHYIQAAVGIAFAWRVHDILMLVCNKQLKKVYKNWINTKKPIFTTLNGIYQEQNSLIATFLSCLNIYCKRGYWDLVNLARSKPSKSEKPVLVPAISVYSGKAAEKYSFEQLIIDAYNHNCLADISKQEVDDILILPFSSFKTQDIPDIETIFRDKPRLEGKVDWRAKADFNSKTPIKGVILLFSNPPVSGLKEIHDKFSEEAGKTDFHSHFLFNGFRLAQENIRIQLKAYNIEPKSFTDQLIEFEKELGKTNAPFTRDFWSSEGDWDYLNDDQKNTAFLKNIVSNTLEKYIN